MGACITGGITESQIRDEVIACLDERLSMVLIEFEERLIK